MIGGTPMADLARKRFERIKNEFDLAGDLYEKDGEYFLLFTNDYPGCYHKNKLHLEGHFANIRELNIFLNKIGKRWRSVWQETD